jgi:hypothetical protein
MAFQNITNLSLGDILQIYYSDGVRNQISRDYRDWEHIKMEKVSDPKGRQVNFYFQNSLGPSAVQRRNPGVVNNFPTAQRVGTSEHTAQIKEISATIELDYNLWQRAQMSSDVRYSEPLKLEMESKLDALKRQLSLEVHLDGTGVLGELAAASGVVVGGDIEFQLSTASAARGHVGAFQFQEILIIRKEDATATALDTDLVTEPVYFKVIERDFENEKVTLRGLDASFNELTIASISVQPDAGEVFYKYQQPTIPDLTSVADYGTVSEAMPGFESLTANDGRVVHGITMSGSTAGTRVQSAGSTLDSGDFEKVLNNVKINVGQGSYSWKMACLAPKRYSELINARDDDRRFNASENLSNGAKAFSFMHRNDNIELYSSEFAKNNRVYIKPEAKNGQGKVFEYHGTDFMPVKAPGGSEFHLKASASGGFENTIASYMDSYGTLICKHPAAVGVIEIV